MRTVLTTATAAILAVGLTACTSTEGGGGPVASAPLPSTPSGGSPTAPGQEPAAPEQRTAVPTNGDDGFNVGVADNWRIGKLSYLAPGKFLVGDTVFFTADDTVLIVAGGKCPDGAARPNNRCTIDNMKSWVQSAPRYVTVSFSGQAATTIRETGG